MVSIFWAQLAVHNCTGIFETLNHFDKLAVKYNSPCPHFPTLKCFADGNRHWRWLFFFFLFFSWCSLRPICYKFVDDETSKHAVWICQRWNHPTCSFPRFSRRCERSETGSAPDWTLLSLTSAVISHGCWRSYNDCLSGRLSAAQNPILSALIGTHIFAQDHIKHQLSPFATEDYGNMSSLSQRLTGVEQGGAWQGAAQIWDLRLTGKTIATRGVGPEAQRPCSKPESILLSAFLYPPFAPLLLRFSVVAGEQRERGTFPGAASFTAHGPKGSRA